MYENSRSTPIGNLLVHLQSLETEFKSQLQEDLFGWPAAGGCPSPPGTGMEEAGFAW